MLVDRYSRIAGIKNVTPGTLRHSFRMNLVQAGVSPFLITDLMGVNSIEMFRRDYRPLQLMMTPLEDWAKLSQLPTISYQKISSQKTRPRVAGKAALILPQEGEP